MGGQAMKSQKKPGEIWVLGRERQGELDGYGAALLFCAKGLADGMGGTVALVLFGGEIKRVPSFADKIYQFADGEAAPYIQAIRLAKFAEKQMPDVILAPGTVWGRSLMPAAAALLKTGLTADCISVTAGEDGRLIQSRPAFGGKLLAHIITPTARPQMATLRVRPVLPDDTWRGFEDGEQIMVSDVREPVSVYPITAKRAEMVSEEIKNPANSKIVIGCGLGAGSSEGFQRWCKIAEKFGGAAAASRAAVNAGLAPYRLQVGQSGMTIEPDLYIAVGISGAVQHLAGIHRAKKIIAVNKDPKAPIFEHADVGIVGDLNAYADLLETLL